MPKPETSNSNNGASFQGPRHRPNWLAAVLCFVLAPCLTVALVDYAPNQTTIHTTQALATNIVGKLGANTVWCMLSAVGAATYIVPVFLFWILYVAIRNPRRLGIWRFIVMILVVVAIGAGSDDQLQTK
jgi:S-DNA-T family DNA segregation ATPase FtsK/SpoIIIE